MMIFKRNIFQRENGGFDSNGFPEFDEKALAEAERRVVESSLRDATTNPGAAVESGKVLSTNEKPTFVTGVQINKANEMIKDPALKDAELL